MTSLIERRHAVLLHGKEVGVFQQRGDHVRFSLLPDYWVDPNRRVLGLWFEDNRSASLASALKLPGWFSNLLPEGRLRDFIASDRHVSPEREMELLAQVGHDLPGAIQVLDGAGAEFPWTAEGGTATPAGFILPDGPVKGSSHLSV